MTESFQAWKNTLRTVPSGHRLPDFFIIGAPKCGTTSLHGWLASHPGTWLRAKEPNFLSPDVVDVRHLPEALRSWEAYLDRICPPEAADRLTGEATPRYLYSDVALETLSVFPMPPRLVILLRNPVDLVHSLHGQMVKQGDERETDFAAAWYRACARHDDPRAWLQKGRCDRRLDYLFFGRFGDRVAEVFARFPQDRVRVMILEETLARDSDASFTEVLKFLGLPPMPYPDLTPRNRREEVGSLRIQGMAARLRRSLEPMLHLMGVRKGRGTGLMRWITRLNRGGTSPQAELPAALRREIAAVFAADVARLESLLGRRIEAWTDFAPQSGTPPIRQGSERQEP